jgi:hypothetical protein
MSATGGATGGAVGGVADDCEKTDDASAASSMKKTKLACARLGLSEETKRMHGMR